MAFTWIIAFYLHLDNKFLVNTTFTEVFRIFLMFRMFQNTLDSSIALSNARAFIVFDLNPPGFKMFQYTL